MNALRDELIIISMGYEDRMRVRCPRLFVCTSAVCGLVIRYAHYGSPAPRSSANCFPRRYAKDFPPKLLSFALYCSVYT